MANRILHIRHFLCFSEKYNAKRKKINQLFCPWLVRVAKSSSRGSTINVKQKNAKTNFCRLSCCQENIGLMTDHSRCAAGVFSMLPFLISLWWHVVLSDFIFKPVSITNQKGFT
jgi:hypothetical protein